MSFKKPFRAVPVKLGPHYRRKQKLDDFRAYARSLAFAATGGIFIGVGSMALDAEPQPDARFSLRQFAAAAGLTRTRPPQAGDHWRSCDEARKVGSAPIYAGEPGYREDMDGDADGIACEPYQGAKEFGG